MRDEYGIEPPPATHVHDELTVERARETTGDRVLRFSEVGAIDVEPVRPNVGTAFGVDQLHVDPDPGAGPAHAAFEDIANPKLATKRR